MSHQDADPTYEAKVRANEWHDVKDLQEVLKVIASIGQFPPDGWHWTQSRGWRCKYIGLQIDMRDGGFTLTDREGRRISLDELRYQRPKDGS